MIRYWVALIRNFMGLILLAAIAAGGASAQDDNPEPNLHLTFPSSSTN